MEQEAVSLPEERPAGRFSAVGVVLKWLGRLLTLLLVVVVGFLIYLHTPPGRQFLLSEIGKFAPASGLRIEAESIEGSVLWSATFNNVHVRDADGTEFLTVPRLELGWRPWRWFFTGLDVRHLVLSGGTLRAVPRLVPGDPDAPILPDFDIRVDRLLIEDLHVAPGLMGDARLIQFDARADVRSGHVEIEARGDLDGADRLALLLKADPDGDAFDIDLDYNAPTGGFLATMVGARSGLAVAIDGDGRWSRWEGRMVARQDGTTVIDASLLNENGEYRLTGDAWPNGNVEGLAARALGQKVSFTATGGLANSALQGTLGLRGEGMELDANGGIDLANNAFRQLRLEARLLDPALFGDAVLLRNARATAVLDGDFSTFTVPHEVTADQIDAGGVMLARLRQRGVALRQGNNWLVPLDVAVARVVSGNAMADPRLVNGRVNGMLTYAPGQGLLTSDALTARFVDLDARLALRADLANGRVSLNGPVNARGLAFDNIGTVDAGARIDATFGGGQPWRLAAQLDGRIARLTNQSIATLAGSNIRFNGGLSLSEGRPIAFTRMRLTGSKLTATLDGRVEGSTTVLTGSGRQEDYGTFNVEATMAGDGLRARLLLDDPYPAAGLRDVEIVIAPDGDGFAIQTRGQSMLGAFDGDIGVMLPSGGNPRIAVTRLDVGQSRVSGNLELVNGGVDGGLILSRGGIDGRVGLAARPTGQAFDVQLMARDASFGGATPLTLARAEIDAQGFIAGEASTLQGTFSGQGIGYGQLFIGRMAGNAQLQDGKGTFNAAIAGRRGSRFELLLNGEADRRRVALAARGSYAGEAITMPRRAVLTAREDGRWELERSQISYGEGFAIASGVFGGGQPAEGRLALADMPLTLADALGGDLGLGGRVSGVVEVASGANDLPTGEARVMIKGLTRSGLVLTSQPLDMAAVVRLTASSLRVRAAMREQGTSEPSGRLNASISNLPGGGDLMPRLYAGRLAGVFNYNGPASSLWRLAALDMLDVTGPMQVTAAMRGSLANPSLAGVLSGEGLRVQSALTGTDISGVTARGTFRDSRLQLASFAGQAPNGGRVSGSGTVDLGGIAAGRGPSIDIRIAASNARILQLPGMGATVTGPLRIVSDGVGGTIAGRLQVQRAEWRLGRAEEVVDLPDIAITEVNSPADIAPPGRAARPWRYLIDARATRGIEVDGMGLDSEWGGAVSLRGTTADPRIGGTVRIVPRQGFYTFAGSRFEITRGIITFDAGSPPDPRLDILAESDVSGLDVDVTVTGTATQAEIAFASVPALPEEEVLARLLFGGSITEISPTDALQLGAALASLRGGGGMDPINRLRSAIGLDRLRIVPADNALDRGTSVALGKNITRRLYVELITDGQGYNATELEFRVTGWLSLLGSISTVGRGYVEATVSRDY
jgi:translocation and assembly module TamB